MTTTLLYAGNSGVSAATALCQRTYGKNAAVQTIRREVMADPSTTARSAPTTYRRMKIQSELHGDMQRCVRAHPPQQSGQYLAKRESNRMGNGLNLDSIPPRSSRRGKIGNLYITIANTHPDAENVKTGTFMDLVHGKYTKRGYRYAKVYPTTGYYQGSQTYRVEDSVQGIWSAAAAMVEDLLKGQSVVVDLSDLRPEGTSVKGSGGVSSGAASFAVEIFDNFAYWASLGGAEHAGAVATLRYVFAPTLRVIRQGGWVTSLASLAQQCAC